MRFYLGSYVEYVKSEVCASLCQCVSWSSMKINLTIVVFLKHCFVSNRQKKILKIHCFETIEDLKNLMYTPPQ